MIVAISGRRQSGKTLASDILIERGYKRFSFATFLKTSVSDILKMPLDDFYDQKKKEAKFPKKIAWDKKAHEGLCRLAKENIKFQGTRMLVSIRDAMEYVGTGILRKHDEDFHVKKLVETLKDYGGDAVIDDMRFPNELRHLQAAGARCVFIMRPYNFEYSNNLVESSVNWGMPFHYVLTNSQSKMTFKKNFQAILKGQVRRRFLGALPTSGLFEDRFQRRDVDSAWWAGYIKGAKAIKVDGRIVIGRSEHLAKKFSNFIARYPLRLVKGVASVKSPFLIEDLKSWSAVGEVPSTVYQIVDDIAAKKAYSDGLLAGTK